MRNHFGKIAVVIAVSASLLGFAAPSVLARPVSTILELYTSQGCSSCPPADELLHEYASREGVLAISLPVDYWDNLGWKDTLGNPANSQRQREYARARGDRSVYTPQIVVNGLSHLAGYDQRGIDQAIVATGEFLSADRVALSLDVSGESLIVSIPVATPAAGRKSGTVWLLLYSKQEEVLIRAGENAGRTISYVNVVREMTPVGMWNGEAQNFTLPKTALMSRGHEGCAVLLQAGMSGPILGAAILDSW